MTELSTALPVTNPHAVVLSLLNMSPQVTKARQYKNSTLAPGIHANHLQQMN